MTAQKILFADDDAEIREVLRLLLTGEGYEVVEASSGSEAIRLVDDSVDLIILDVMMPGMDGYAACAEIRKRSSAPIFFLTAKSQDSDKTLGFSMGGDDYLVFSVQNIYESIWKEPYFYGSNNTVMVHIRNIRRKLGDVTQNSRTIQTVWGRGYRIE